jgi:HD-GYP domain-containing protein (c-di-GMP phosphodiesterase class II)
MLITPDMKLGKSIYSEAVMLLRKGTANLNRYINKLNELGIQSIYVDDKASEGIEIPDAISAATRKQCKAVLTETFSNIQQGGNLESESISYMVTHLIEEVMSQPNIIVSLQDIGSTRDETLLHCVNTAVYGLVLANRVGLSEISQRDLAQGLLLHDIGKIALDQNILYKNGELTSEEFEHIRMHPQLGYEILKKDPLLTEATRRIALQHHERLDGSGYAFGAKGEEINTLIRMAAIVDVYEALTVNRCYRKSFTPSKAADILTADAVGKLDAELVANFFQSIAIYPNGNMLLLSDGRLAVVKEQNPGIPFRPIVRLLETGEGHSLPGEEIDLSVSLNITILEDDPSVVSAMQKAM